MLGLETVVVSNPLFLVTPDPRTRDVELILRLDIVQMEESPLAGLLNPDPGEPFLQR